MMGVGKTVEREYIRQGVWRLLEGRREATTAAPEGAASTAELPRQFHVRFLTSRTLINLGEPLSLWQSVTACQGAKIVIFH